jgi:hypothetical protein
MRFANVAGLRSASSLIVDIMRVWEMLLRVMQLRGVGAFERSSNRAQACGTNVEVEQTTNGF